MYERFTDRARKVMQLANQEALRFNHEYLGTEHILLGLIEEGSGVAVNVLKNLDIDLHKIRLEVERIVQSGPDMVSIDILPPTPRAKRVIEDSMEAARNLGHNYIGTEHILLGLLREQDSVAAQVFMNFGLKLEEVREEVLSLRDQKLEVGEGGNRSGSERATWGEDSSSKNKSDVFKTSAFHTLLAHSNTARLLILLICSFSLLGNCAIETLPLSSPTLPSRYHHWAIVVPGAILNLPVILLRNLLPHDGSTFDIAANHLLATVSPFITIAWNVLLFLMLNRIVRFFEK